MILWTKEFETGSAGLDQQHRLLIDNINLLEDRLRTVNPTMEDLAFAVQLVDYLEAYGNHHFKCEEKCMESMQCPVREQNRQEHERFRGFVRTYRKQCQTEGFRIELLQNLHEVIRSWIEEHILKIDTQLRRCIPRTLRFDPATLP